MARYLVLGYDIDASTNTCGPVILDKDAFYKRKSTGMLGEPCGKDFLVYFPETKAILKKSADKKQYVLESFLKENPVMEKVSNIIPIGNDLYQVILDSSVSKSEAQKIGRNLQAMKQEYRGAMMNIAYQNGESIEHIDSAFPLPKIKSKNPVPSIFSK